MAKFEAGIFDAGGVLHAVDLSAIQQDMQNTLEVKGELFNEVWGELTPLLGRGAITEEQYWQQFLDLTGSKAPLPQVSLFLREYGKGFVKHQGVLDIVKELRELGLKLAVLSNSIPPHSRFNKEQGLYALFDVVALSDEIKVRKPDPEAYMIVLNRLGVSAQHTFMVDDLPENLTAFEALGGTGILFENEKQLRKDLKLLQIPLV